MIAAEQAGTLPIPKLRLRHILVRPLSGGGGPEHGDRCPVEAATREAQKIHDAAVKPVPTGSRSPSTSDDTANKDSRGDLGCTTRPRRSLSPSSRRRSARR